jgi:hypothetical protein
MSPQFHLTYQASSIFNIDVQPGFFFQFCDEATLAINHPQEELAKFCYKWDWKVEKLKYPVILLLLFGTHCPNMTISEFFSSNFGYFGPFSSQNNFVWVTLDSSLGCQGTKNCQKSNLNFSNVQSYIHKSWDFHNLQRRIGVTLSQLLTKLSLAHNKPKDFHTWSCSQNSKFFLPYRKVWISLHFLL